MAHTLCPGSHFTLLNASMSAKFSVWSVANVSKVSYLRLCYHHGSLITGWRFCLKNNIMRYELLHHPRTWGSCSVSGPNENSPSSISVYVLTATNQDGVFVKNARTRPENNKNAPYNTRRRDEQSVEPKKKSLTPDIIWSEWKLTKSK